MKCLIGKYGLIFFFLYSRAEHSYSMYFDFESIAESNFPYKHIYMLYPYETVKLSVVLVYGDDFPRRKNTFLISKSVEIQFMLVILFLIFVVFVLRLIRQKWRLERRDLSATVIDCIIPFIGGGNLQMQNKLERWFFTILLFSAFLILAVVGGDLIDSITKIGLEKFDKLEQLAKINTPFIVDRNVGYYNGEIEEMMGCVSFSLNRRIKKFA